MIQLIGTDAEYRQYAKSGNTTKLTFKDQPVGATLRVKIVALNGSLEAASGPEEEIVVE